MKFEKEFYFVSGFRLIKSKFSHFDYTFTHHIVLENGFTVRKDYLFSNPKEALIHQMENIEECEKNILKKSKDYIKYVLLSERIKNIVK